MKHGVLNRQSLHALYVLKRRYGGSIDIYQIVSSDTDPRTGQRTSTKQVTHVDRAIVLPSQVTRDQKQSVSLISVNKLLVMGGTYDASERKFVVDRNDVPNITRLNEDDYLVYKGKKYQIKSFEEYEFKASWLITARLLLGEVPEQIRLVRAESYLSFSDQASA